MWQNKPTMFIFIIDVLLEESKDPCLNIKRMVEKDYQLTMIIMSTKP